MKVDWSKRCLDGSKGGTDDDVPVSTTAAPKDTVVTPATIAIRHRPIGTPPSCASDEAAVLLVLLLAVTSAADALFALFVVLLNLNWMLLSHGRTEETNLFLVC